MAEKYPKRGELWQSNSEPSTVVLVARDADEHVFEGTILNHMFPCFVGYFVTRWGVRFFHKFEGSIELKND